MNTSVGSNVEPDGDLAAGRALRYRHEMDDSPRNRPVLRSTASPRSESPSRLDPFVVQGRRSYLSRCCRRWLAP